MRIPRSEAKCSANVGALSRRVAARVAAISLALLAAAAASCRGGSNPIVLENARRGAPGWELSNPALAHEIEGYAGAASVAPGDTVELHVSCVSPRFDVEVFRMGWYGGAGARRVTELRGLPGARRAVPRPRSEDGLVECAWPVSCRVSTGADWVSGVYLARLAGSRDGKQAFVPFVLREREARTFRGSAAALPPRRAPILFQCSVTTWAAYNNWGGKSLYDFNSVGGRALRVSFDRPYSSSPEAKRGAGAGEFLTVGHVPRAGGWEYPLVRWLERQGYDLAYATNLDVQRDDSLCLGRKAVLIAGHDEYWSRMMRDHIERARDRGVNLGIFAANVSYWQVRLEPSSGRVSDRIIFCAKDPERDPVYNMEKDEDITVRFRNLHPRRPEVSLVGMMIGAENVEGDFVPSPEQRGHWIYRGTGVATGRTRIVPGLQGYEVDRSFSSDSIYGRWSPRGLTVLARSSVRTRDGKQVPTETTIYVAPSGALVFATGTMQWSWGLDDWGAPALRPARRHPDIEGITRNVLERFLRGSGRAPDPRSPG